MDTSNSGSPLQGPTGLQVETGATSRRRFGVRWILLSVMTLTAVGLATVWLSAAPTLQWSSPSIVEFVLPSGSQKLTVTFHTTENLSQVDVVVAPALSSVVSVRPTRLTKVSRNKDYKLDLAITAPASSGVAFQGTIQLKLTQGNSATNSQPLPITIVVHDEPVPPDPGEAGKATLEGIDADGDGVRDDLQRYIISNYLDSAATRAALSQLSIAAQARVTDSITEDTALSGSAELRNAVDCLIYVRGVDQAAPDYKSLRSVLLNTPARGRAWKEALELISGRIFETTPGDQLKTTCSVDPDTFQF